MLWWITTDYLTAVGDARTSMGFINPAAVIILATHPKVQRMDIRRYEPKLKAGRASSI